MHKNKMLIIGNNLKLTIVFSSAGHLGRLLHHLPGLLEVAGGGGDPGGEAHQVPEVRSAHPHHLVITAPCCEEVLLLERVDQTGRKAIQEAGSWSGSSLLGLDLLTG